MKRCWCCHQSAETIRHPSRTGMGWIDRCLMCFQKQTEPFYMLDQIGVENIDPEIRKTMTYFCEIEKQYRPVIELMQ